MRLLDGKDAQKRDEKYQEYMNVREQYEQANQLYGVKLTDQQKKKLEAYFNDSVRKLEKELGKDLSKLWF